MEGCIDVGLICFFRRRREVGIVGFFGGKDGVGLCLMNVWVGFCFVDFRLLCFEFYSKEGVMFFF